MSVCMHVRTCMLEFVGVHVHACMRVYVHVCEGAEEVFVSPAAGVTGNCKLPDMGAGN